MKYRVLNTLEKSLWRRCLSSFPEISQDIYFLPEYYELYEKEFVKAQCFIFEDKEKRLLYPYLKTHISNAVGFKFDNRYYDIEGAYGYNGLITNTDDRIFMNEFAAVFADYCNNENIIAEFTRFNPVLKNHNLSVHMDIEMVNKNVIIDLTIPENDIWMKSYEHCVRKNVNKAIRNTLYVKAFMGAELEDDQLDEFLEIYHSTMDRRAVDKTFYFDRHYLNELRKLLRKNSFFFFTLMGSKAISCELVMFNQKTAYSFLGGTLSGYNHLRPNSLLKHEIITRLKKLNFSTYCMGGGIDIDDNICKYKKRFSKGELTNFYIGKKIYNEKIYYEICNSWEKYFPEKRELCKNFFLKYKIQRTNSHRLNSKEAITNELG